MAHSMSDPVSLHDDSKVKNVSFFKCQATSGYAVTEPLCTSSPVFMFRKLPVPSVTFRSFGLKQQEPKSDAD